MFSKFKFLFIFINNIEKFLVKSDNFYSLIKQKQTRDKKAKALESIGSTNLVRRSKDFKMLESQLSADLNPERFKKKIEQLINRKLSGVPGSNNASDLKSIDASNADTF